MLLWLHAPTLLSLEPPSLPPPPPFHTIFDSFIEVTSNGYNGPCRGTSPTDNDVTAYGANKIQNPALNCQVCADLCRRNVNASGYPYNCVAFECTPSLDHPDAPQRAGGPMCELWAKPAQFVASAACANDGEVCTVDASGYWCYSKLPPPPPRVISGFVEVTSNGYNGPCRGTSPTDNDLTAYGANKLQNPTLNCDLCADLCRRNVDINGDPYNCVAYECSVSLDHPFAPQREGGPMCELWSKPANYVASAACANDGEVCTVSASGYWCYSKLTSASGDADANSASPSAPSLGSAGLATGVDAAGLGTVIILVETVIGVSGAILFFVIVICICVYAKRPPPPADYKPMAQQHLITPGAPQSHEARKSIVEMQVAGQ